MVRKVVQFIFSLLFIRNIGGQFLNESDECTTMNDQHWDLIQWFYGRTDKIFVTFIADTTDGNHHFQLQDKILRKLFQSRIHFCLTRLG